VTEKPEPKNVVAARLLRGSGRPRERYFHRGGKARLVSVGEKAAWHVSAPGVEPVHAFLYFDGQDVWAFGVNAGPSPQLDGRDLGECWTQLVPPAVLSLGDAQIAFESFAIDPTQAEPDAPRASGFDGANALAEALSSAPPQDATILAPLPEEIAAARDRPRPRRRSWKRLVACALVLATLGLFVARLAKHPIRVPWVQQALAVARRRAPSKLPPASAVVPPVSTRAAISAPVTTPEDPCAPAGAPDDDDAQDDELSLERRAADALVSGDEGSALQSYCGLATSHPDKRVFREAARILAHRRRVTRP
jgi:hypothetical protein